MTEEQFLIERRCNFRLENRVVVLHIRIIVHGIPAVHGMSAFVRHREHVAENVFLVVEENIRVALVHAA